MQISCLIIDDERLSRKMVKNLIKKFPAINCKGECMDGESAIKRINSLQPDLIYLDINLKDMTGFDVLRHIKVTTKPLVIFISAHEMHALKAFDFFAFDYILKPFKEDRFEKSIRKVIEYFEKERLQKHEHKIDRLIQALSENYSFYSQVDNYTDKKLPIKIQNNTVFIDVANILYVISSGYNVEIYTYDDDTYIIRESLTNLKQQLGNNFLRIHRSYLINKAFIMDLSHSNYGEIDVRMIDKKLFRVSKSAKKEFLKTIGVK